MTQSIKPSYQELYESGELARRVEELESRLKRCNLCPRQCFANRTAGERKFCRSGALPIVSNFCAHRGEEPVISGTRGSGTIFFGNCNMQCVYCQNYQISQSSDNQQNEITCSELAEKMLYLQNELHCHNINLVSPTHFVPQIARAILEAIPKGLHLPLVYNTGGYDRVETIALLDGIIDIYLPDLRYASERWAMKYSFAPMYVKSARAAIKEMYRQVGNLIVDEDDIAIRGLIVRHLILPNNLAGSEETLTWLAEEISPNVTISIMSQYYPTHLSTGIPDLARKITTEEYSSVVDIVNKLSLENGWLQEMGADSNYRPDFERENHPFE
jgi:putative pyruvate formate lyase activating enzyme